MEQAVKKQLGIYVHIPFCVKKCLYCDFLSGPATEDVQERYVEALLSEIDEFVNKYGESVSEIGEGKLEGKVEGEVEGVNGASSVEDLKENVGEQTHFQVYSVFFGGGTPSAIDSKLIVRICEKLRANFDFIKDAEISIECNPGTLTRQKAEDYRNAGINRISFGLQATDNETLKLIGRIHTYEEFLESFRIARLVGFDNINVDLMSALPGQSKEAYLEGVQKIIELSPEHISAYSLILEEGTFLGDNIDKFPPVVDEDTEREMYWETRDLLAKAGFKQYEISNYSKPGRVCRHNLSYWERRDYVGFGLGAASLFMEKRWSNIGDLEGYIEVFEGASKEEIGIATSEYSKLTVSEQMEEFMFLGLRKTAGISKSEFKNCFGRTVEDIFGSVVKKYAESGHIEAVGDVIRLTEKGVDVSNVILAEFLLEE